MLKAKNEILKPALVTSKTTNINLCRGLNKGEGVKNSQKLFVERETTIRDPKVLLLCMS